MAIADHVWRPGPKGEEQKCGYMNCRGLKSEHYRAIKGQTPRKRPR